jgi:antitoxin CptB
MTGTGRSSDGLDPRRRRALFRAWRRGTREMDLLLGPFADAHIGQLGDHDLADFEALLEVPDDELFTWITGGVPTVSRYRTPIFDAIVSFHNHRGHA